ncbi:increased DNA methylation 1 isoform X2 [Amaranthus tricolor]|uniref:increased DNA methylation 1 isoform X2 n=1 Tax=Amaranthus tricolor TaxID=29722 RepID=UPI002587F5AA|nr:increased DNA methylation 1 isoform X2 [Amaranthus tricolor]
MKRELAALESNSPLPISIGRITRSSKQLSGVSSPSGVSKSLVYKRVKRSVKVDEGKSNGVINGIANVVNKEIVTKGSSIEVVVEDINGTSNVIDIVDDGLNNSLQSEEPGLVSHKDSQELSLVKIGDTNGGSMEIDKDKIVEGVSPLKIVKGTVKKSSVERYPRRFTRSALKSKEDIMPLGNVFEYPNEGKLKTVMNETNGEICKEIVVWEPQKSESNGEVKSSLPMKYTRRFTRSSLKPKIDGINGELVSVDLKEVVVPVTSNVEAECGVKKQEEKRKSATRGKKLEMKMSKQISHVKAITTVQELFETGLLEGCSVYYDGGKDVKLTGRIRGIGILCSCGLCKGCKVIPPSLFEIHACNKYKRAVQYICLENGRSLINILKTCKSTRLNTVEATVQNAVGPLPEKKLLVCQSCKEPFSSMDGESSEPVCGRCVMSNSSPIGPVYSARKFCRSSKFSISSQAVPACDMPQDSSQKKSAVKSAKPFTPNSVKVASNLLKDTNQLKAVEKSMPRLRSSSRAEKASETKTSEEIVKNLQEVADVVKTCSSPVTQKSSKAKRLKEVKKRSFKATSSTKHSEMIRSRKCSPRSDSAKSTKKLSVTPKPPKTPSFFKSSEKKTSGKITRKDLRLHKLVFEDDVLPDGTELGYYARGQKLLDGFKKGAGILCNCCDTVVSASQFEAHAGCASRRKPYCYIYTSNGVSLHELSVTLIKDRRHSAKYNDDLCSICADGGNLLLCDGCPRAFHVECASLPSIPRGKWYCKYCENMFEREKFVAHNANALAAGRVSGVDSIEQITKRSIRIVNNLASEVSACILCRGYDFSKSGFGPRTIILCDQCEKEYHVGCLKEYKMADLKELPDGKWFCSTDCGRIESTLENLLSRGVEKLPGSLVDVIQKKNIRTGPNSGTDVDVSWRLLSGKIASPGTRPLLSQAVAIFHESFAPIIDVVSGHDLIPAMVYGRNVGGQEYSGMYCAVLTVNGCICWYFPYIWFRSCRTPFGCNEQR